MKKYILLFVIFTSSLALGQVPTRPIIYPTPGRGTPIPTRPVPVTPLPTVVPTVISTATPIPPITPTPTVSPSTKINITVPEGVIKIDVNNKLVWADNSLVYVQLCEKNTSSCYILTLGK